MYRFKDGVNGDSHCSPVKAMPLFRKTQQLMGVGEAVYLCLMQSNGKEQFWDTSRSEFIYSVEKLGLLKVLGRCWSPDAKQPSRVNKYLNGVSTH